MTAGIPGALVACPECGLEFVRRGLQAHRRMRHGVGADGLRATPAASDPAPPESNANLAGALSELARAVERLQAHVEKSLPEGTSLSEPPPEVLPPARGDTQARDAALQK